MEHCLFGLAFIYLFIFYPPPKREFIVFFFFFDKQLRFINIKERDT